MQASNKNPVMESAKNYIEEGFAVFALTANSKIPLLGSNGFKNATKDINEITNIFSNNCNANIAIATGSKSGIIVIDIDINNDVDGNQSFEGLCADESVPDTRIVETPSGGKHYYFRLNPDMVFGCKVGLYPGIDIRSDGGYIVAPPSIIDGNSYQLGGNVAIADLPQWLYNRLKTRMADKPKTVINNNGGFSEGVRNECLFRLAANYRAKGLDYEDARILILKYASNCTPNFPEDEAIQCLNSAWRYGSNHSYTQVGLAKRLADYYPDSLKYIPDIEWMIWNEESGYWKVDSAGAYNRIIEVSECIVGEAASEKLSADNKKAIKKFASSMQNHNSISGTLKIAISMPEFRIDKSQLDANPFDLKVKNGVLDLSSGNLSLPHPSQYITKCCLANYDQKADCPRFKAFLSQIFQADEALISFVQRAVGYSLTGKTSEQCMFVLHGAGANGKSVFQLILQDILGDFAQTAPTQMLSNKVRSATNDLARLKGARILIASEERRGSIWDEAIVKQLTGGDVITARPLYKEFFEFTPTAKIWLSTNYLPNILGAEHAIWRRIKVIPFRYQVPESDIDRELIERLREELPGILTWAVEGCKEWQQVGLGSCNAVDNALNEFRKDCDQLYGWLSAKTTNNGEVRASCLYECYLEYCNEMGVEAISQNKFKAKMEEKGFGHIRRSEGCYYIGIGIKHKGNRKRRRRSSNHLALVSNP